VGRKGKYYQGKNAQTASTKRMHKIIAPKNQIATGKLECNSTTMVTILDENLREKDLTKKQDIEQAILRENATKFQQSFNSPFYTAPLAADFGFKALTPAANQVLMGVYTPPTNMDEP
jgi:hypothetical protein